MSRQQEEQKAHMPEIASFLPELPRWAGGLVLSFFDFHELLGLLVVSRAWNAAGKDALERVDALLLQNNTAAQLAVRHCRRLKRLRTSANLLDSGFLASLIEANSATLTSLAGRFPITAAAKCPNLRQLATEKISDTEAPQLFAACPRLEDIECRQVDLPVLLAAKLPLRRLHYGGLLWPAEYELLCSYAGLEALDLQVNECAPLSAQNLFEQRMRLFTGLAALPKLSSLRLCFGPSVAPHTLGFEQARLLFPELRELRIRHTFPPEPEGVVVRFHGSFPCIEAPKLRQLTLVRINGEAGLLRRDFPALVALQMEGLRFALTPAEKKQDLEEPGWQALESLCLLDVHWLDNIYAYLRDCPLPSLKRLSISTYYVDRDDCISSLIAANPRLEELSVKVHVVFPRRTPPSSSAGAATVLPQHGAAALRRLAVQAAPGKRTLLRGLGRLQLPQLQQLTLADIGERLDLTPMLQCCCASLTALALSGCEAVKISSPVEMKALRRLAVNKCPCLDQTRILRPVEQFSKKGKLQKGEKREEFYWDERVIQLSLR